MQFEIQEREFVQILHCNSAHWLTISTIGCKPLEVFMYDSLYSGASECVQCQIAIYSFSITIKSHYVKICGCPNAIGYI